MVSAFGSLLAFRHAKALLTAFNDMDTPEEVVSDHPALAWGRAGLADVTGFTSGAGLIAPVALTAAADGALFALKKLASHRNPAADLPENGAALLGERARLLGLKRRGNISPNGTCYLLPTRNGNIALSLPRAADWELIPAFLGEPAENLVALASLAVKRDRAELLDRGRLLGLAIAPDETVTDTPPPFKMEQLARPRMLRSTPPLVVDLSALWAGPLAGALLGAAGMRVIKIESTTRPDGARAGNAPFYNLLNARKESAALDFRNAEDLRHLRGLIAAADLIIEGSRPRALAELGVDARKEAARGATWLSITAHGRTGEAANWIGYGDDAAIAGGLSAAMRRAYGEALFAGDAIADPLTGITAAFAGLASYITGGGRLISLSLADVIANACALHETSLLEIHKWRALAKADILPRYPMRRPAAAAPALGADTARILSEFGTR